MGEEGDFAGFFTLEEGGGGIGGDDVGTEDHLPEHCCILDGNALGAVAEEGAVTINDIEIRFTPCREIGDTLVQIVPVPPTAIPDDTHEIFHGEGDNGTAVIFEHGDVEEDITLGDKFMDIG